MWKKPRFHDIISMEQISGDQALKDTNMPIYYDEKGAMHDAVSSVFEKVF